MTNRIRLCGPLAVAACLAVSAAEAASVSFIAFGDTGTGKPEQYAVGAAMARVCAARGCDFTVMLGDNFYPNGVGSVDDPQWATKFVKPYAGLRVPVYASLGNHDNGTVGGEGDNNARGDVQVQYHYWADLFTSIWRMPARFYSFTAPLRSTQRPLAEFFALDSSPLAAGKQDPDPKWDRPRYASRHLEWLREASARSEAPWKIAFAHYPAYSNGAPPGKVSSTYREFVKQGVCGEMDLSLAGHHHNLQWLKPVADCGRTHHIISGAAARLGAMPSQRDHEAFWESDSRLGFFWLQLRADRYTAVVYTLDEAGDAAVAFELTVGKP